MFRQVITVLLPAVGGCSSGSRASHPLKAHLYSAEKAEMDEAFCLYFALISSVILHIAEELTMSKQSSTTEDHRGSRESIFQSVWKIDKKDYTGI